MITRDELADFITRLSEESTSQEEWFRFALNHFTDGKMETARRTFVRYCLGYPPPQDEAHLSLKERLVAIAATLKE